MKKLSSEEERVPRKSKSQQKRDAVAAQALGAELVELTTGQLKALLDKLDLPESLNEALLMCGSIKAREGRRRQLQLIGKLMRDVDPEPVQKLLVETKRGGQVATIQLHKIERWRERLLTEGPEAYNELLSGYPHADGAEIKRLIARAAKESVQKQPPRSSRLLFKYLRELMVD